MLGVTSTFRPGKINALFVSQGSRAHCFNDRPRPHSLLGMVKFIETKLQLLSEHGSTRVMFYHYPPAKAYHYAPPQTQQAHRSYERMRALAHTESSRSTRGDRPLWVPINEPIP